MMEMIEVPTSGETIDPKYLIARLEDDKKARGNFFDLYCQQNLPFAFLALNQGSLTNALGCIIHENRGFINFSTGESEEINQQKEVAKKIVSGETFYIDGISALVLSETALIEKIYKYLPHIKIPQSVITSLLEIKEKFRYSPGQAGYMGYAQGRLNFSSINRDRREAIKANFEKAIKLFESNPENIVVISKANKAKGFSEQNIDPALSDACI